MYSEKFTNSLKTKNNIISDCLLGSFKFFNKFLASRFFPIFYRIGKLKIFTKFHFRLGMYV